MKNKWHDILNSKPELDPQKLMDYLEGRLDDAEKHRVESILADGDFENDALEGLAQLKDKQKIASILAELNASLKKNAKARNKHKAQTLSGFPGWLLFSTVTIILLILLGYIIYKMYTTPAG